MRYAPNPKEMKKGGQIPYGLAPPALSSGDDAEFSGFQGMQM